MDMNDRISWDAEIPVQDATTAVTAIAKLPLVWSLLRSSIYASQHPLSQVTALSKAWSIVASWRFCQEGRLCWLHRVALSFRRLYVIKMLKKFHHSPPWVRLLETLSPSFGFAAHSSSVIQTLTCFFFLLPTSFAGLLGYGYGEGSCAAYPFR